MEGPILYLEGHSASSDGQDGTRIDTRVILNTCSSLADEGYMQSQCRP